jgi:hypothetical protein
LIASDPSFSLANDDISCDDSDLDGTQLFGRKTRRENKCQTRTPVTGAGNESNDDERIDFQKFFDEQMRKALPFKKSNQLCPAKIFGFATIPVCVHPTTTQILSSPLTRWSDLNNVYPCKFSSFYAMSFEETKSLMNIRKNKVYVSRAACFGDFALWCCAQVVTTVRQHIYSLKPFPKKFFIV